MNLESVVYPIFGTSMVVGHHIKRQLDVLNEILPPEFKGRALDDLGCGDGRITLLLKEILRPSSLRGFDVQPSLVRSARHRGVKARILNLNGEVPTGELAVLWGVLHHLDDPESVLQDVRSNYSFVIVREPVKYSFDSLIELGHPMRREDIESLTKRSLPGASFYGLGGSVILLYAR